MKINEFASMGGTSSGAIATVASPLMKKPIKRVQEEDSYDYGEPKRGDHVTFNGGEHYHGRVMKNNKDGSYNVRWTQTKTVKAHTPAEFTIIHRDKKNEGLESTILRR